MVVVSPVVPSLLSNIKRGHLSSRRTKLYLHVVCLYDKPTIYKHIYKCAFVDLSSTLTTFFNAWTWTIYMYSAPLPFHSLFWHVQNVTIPCRSQELLPFLSVMYFFLPPFSTNYSTILSHLILPSIFWSASQICCFQIHI